MSTGTVCRLQRPYSSCNYALDLNGDGEVNLKDALWVSIVGATATTAAAAGYLSGAALVSATSTAIGTTLVATGDHSQAPYGISIGTTTGALSVVNQAL